MSDLIQQALYGALIFVGGFLLWAVAKYAVSKLRERAEKTPTKADDEFVDDLEAVVDRFTPGDD